MKLTLHRFDLHTRHPFTTSRSSTQVRSAVVVELEQDGRRGYGEAPETASYGGDAAATQAVLEGLRPRIEAARLDDPADLWEQVGPLLAGTPSAQCALDVAAHDLWGKLRGTPVWKLWGLQIDRTPPSDYTIGIDTVDVMVAKLAEMPGFSVYKIKLGTPRDLDLVRTLRRHTEAVFRVDVNGGWTAEQTIARAPDLKSLGVELIEQPLPPEAWESMRRVLAQSVLPLVADESCRSQSDLDRCAACFHGVNIKLAKCGGLTPARRMVGRARQLGLKVMIGCFTESTINISAAAQLLPLADYADLDGALLLADDIASGVRIDRGRTVYPQAAGCGVELAVTPDRRERP
jgi:L-alanine-DL-glutamate epimerase-like enolase superfamily enzyme